MYELFFVIYIYYVCFIISSSVLLNTALSYLTLSYRIVACIISCRKCLLYIILCIGLSFCGMCFESESEIETIIRLFFDLFCFWEEGDWLELDIVRHLSCCSLPTLHSRLFNWNLEYNFQDHLYHFVDLQLFVIDFHIIDINFQIQFHSHILLLLERYCLHPHHHVG